MYRAVNYCRACKSLRLTPVFDLGVQPLANDFTAADEWQAGYAPLRVLFCEACSLAQLSVVVDPALLYRHYNYVTSNSATMRTHFDHLASTLIAENGYGSVLEIGSNDGSLLAFLKEKGFTPAVGIDPAANLSTLATAKGVETLSSPFSRASAESAKNLLMSVDIIIARHVFCHVDDWQEFLHSCSEISHKNTLICLEVPYVGDLLARTEFDTIYHEHTSYLSIQGLLAALRGTGLILERVIKVQIHGGAILLMIRRSPRLCPPIEVPEIKAEDWRAFALRAKTKISDLTKVVRGLNAEGKIVAGYGASAKSTVWINACGFTEKDIRFITDNTPQKIGKYSPGTNIQIVDERELCNLMPDYCVLFAWNYKAEVIEKNQQYLKAGGKFIVPSPEIEIV